jgi:hypothetical protein
MRRAVSVVTFACLVLALGSAASAAAAKPRSLSFALDGFQARAPIKLTVAIEDPPRPNIVMICPSRCTVRFGPGTRIPSPVSYHIADETTGSPEYGAYVSALGSPYGVLSYGACQHPDLSDPQNSSCAGTATRSTVVRVHLQYRPLVTLVATGSIEDIRPTYYSGVAMDAQNTSRTAGDSADCDFTIDTVSGDRCRYRLDPGPVSVSTSDGGDLYQFAGYTNGPCSGQEIGAPSQHGCMFTLGASDVTIQASVRPPPDAPRVAPLDSKLPAPPRYRSPGPLRSDFQSDPTSEALDQVLSNLFDSQYGPGTVQFQIFVSLVKGSGLMITGNGGPGAGATAAGPPLFSGRLRATDDELAPLTITLTRAGQRLFAKAGRHSVRITATYDPPGGPPVRRSRSGRVRG